jgi:hypothetical protein
MSLARSLLASVTVLAALAACDRNPSQPAARPTVEPVTQPAAQPAQPAAQPAQPAAQAAAPAGPAQSLDADEYRLAVALTAPAGTAPGAFRVELHGNGEYHVNDQYPIAVEATVENGSMPKTSLRRGDAAEFTNAVARFEQPVTAAGPGVRVRGTVRFGVCRAEQCAFFSREFAVAAP